MKTKIREDEFIKDFNDGMLVSSTDPTVQTLSKKYGKSRATINRKITSLGLSRENPKSIWLTAERKEQLRQLYVVKCKTLAEIGKVFGVSAPRIDYVLKTYYPEFKQKQNKKNLSNYVAKEYLSEKSQVKLTKKQAEEVATWLENNRELLLETEGLFLTSEQEDTITHFSGEYFDGRLY